MITTSTSLLKECAINPLAFRVKYFSKAGAGSSIDALGQRKSNNDRGNAARSNTVETDYGRNGVGDGSDLYGSKDNSAVAARFSACMEWYVHYMCGIIIPLHCCFLSCP